MKKLVNRVLVDCTDEEILELEAIKASSRESLLEEASSDARNKRNYLLSATDWMALSDNTMTPEWAAYRQALRDITDQEGFPYSVIWPTKP